MAASAASEAATKTDLRKLEDRLNSKIYTVESRLNIKIDNLETKVDGLETKVDGLGAKVDGLGAKMDILLNGHNPDAKHS